jgi:SAM-dependent methyltransferase
MYRYGDPADHDRGELDRFLPDTDGLFVDIGCGTGRLAARLRRSGRRVVGIEPDPELAREAAARLDEVIALPVEEALDRLAGTIQCAILADVLEHTTDPADVLRRVVARLAPEGRLLASFPNAAWAPYLRALAAGRWDVTLAGGQARDHFAQFTPSSFAALAAACGATVERLEPLGDGLPFGLRLWSRLAAWSAGGEARHLEGAQWVATLRRREG